MTEELTEATVFTAPIPPNEVERLAALRRYDILDTPPELAFDRITALAARLFDAPIALVSLLDDSRAWFKSCYGFDAREVKRDDTLCSFAVLFDDVFVIPDTRKDARFACNPFVCAEPGIRFYAGAPLLTADGFNLGTLCLLDGKPREDLAADQRATLADLAAMVVDELELRFAARKIAKLDAALLDVTEGVAAKTGTAFFSALVQHFTQALGVDYTYIGLLAVGGQERIETIAACQRGTIIDNFEYLLRDTPCREVLYQRKICCYPRDVQAQFPNAPLLAPLEIEGYVATPFYDALGNPLGLLGVMSCAPLEDMQLIESLLTIFAMRVAAELERQRAEEQRTQMLQQEQKARQQAENANRIKDEFLAVLSHELRSPLNPILGWAKLLQTRQHDAATVVRGLQTIERNAQLQTQLIEDLLDVSRILRGKLTLNVATVDLRSTIAAALETVRLAAEAKSIQIEPELAAASPLVAGDSSRLQQVVWNLLSNAVKFTPVGGKVVIRLGEAASGAATERATHAVITVADTGEGIRPDALPYIFESFRQADSSTTRRFGGLGLGLAIVRHLAELHGGTVAVESAGVGKGATFTVHLPLFNAASEAIEAIDLPAHEMSDALPLRGARILVVDDETDSRELIVVLLEQAGAEVTAVSSATEAISVLEHASSHALDQLVDVLVSDIGMPEVDGYTMMRQIQAQLPRVAKRVRAIALTAYAGEVNQQRALSAGFVCHLAKPVDPSELTATVRSVMGQPD